MKYPVGRPSQNGGNTSCIFSSKLPSLAHLLSWKRAFQVYIKKVSTAFFCIALVKHLIGKFRTLVKTTSKKTPAPKRSYCKNFSKSNPKENGKTRHMSVFYVMHIFAESSVFLYFKFFSHQRIELRVCILNDNFSKLSERIELFGLPGFIQYQIKK